MSKCPVCKKELYPVRNEYGLILEGYQKVDYHFYFHQLEDMAQKRSAKSNSEGIGKNKVGGETNV